MSSHGCSDLRIVWVHVMMKERKRETHIHRKRPKERERERERELVPCKYTQSFIYPVCCFAVDYAHDPLVGSPVVDCHQNGGFLPQALLTLMIKWCKSRKHTRNYWRS
jgi:hypothetical protein